MFIKKIKNIINILPALVLFAMTAFFLLAISGNNFPQRKYKQLTELGVDQSLVDEKLELLETEKYLKLYNFCDYKPVGHVPVGFRTISVRKDGTFAVGQHFGGERAYVLIISGDGDIIKGYSIDFRGELLIHWNEDELEIYLLGQNIMIAVKNEEISIWKPKEKSQFRLEVPPITMAETERGNYYFQYAVGKTEYVAVYRENDGERVLLYDARLPKGVTIGICVLLIIGAFFMLRKSNELCRPKENDPYLKKIIGKKQ